MYCLQGAVDTTGEGRGVDGQCCWREVFQGDDDMLPLPLTQGCALFDGCMTMIPSNIEWQHDKAKGGAHAPAFLWWTALLTPAGRPGDPCPAGLCSRAAL